MHGHSTRLVKDTSQVAGQRSVTHQQQNERWWVTALRPNPPYKRGENTLNLSLSHYLVLSAVLFAISVVGIFLNRKNLIVLLMAIELMLLAVNINFIAFSHYLGDYHGQVFVFFILTVAAAEAAIGLAILVVLFRNLSTIDVQELDLLKG